MVINFDILIMLDYEDFFLDFLEKGVDMVVVMIFYFVDVFYVVLEMSNYYVLFFWEKFIYIYYFNGGIYLMKWLVIDCIFK